MGEFKCRHSNQHSPTPHTTPPPSSALAQDSSGGWCTGLEILLLKKRGSCQKVRCHWRSRSRNHKRDLFVDLFGDMRHRVQMTASVSVATCTLIQGGAWWFLFIEEDSGVQKHHKRSWGFEPCLLGPSWLPFPAGLAEEPFWWGHARWRSSRSLPQHPDASLMRTPPLRRPNS